MDEVASLAGSADGVPALLDLRGLKCPLPVLRTRRALRRLAGGRAVRILCTDPLAGIDIPNLVREDGHRLEYAAQSEGVSIFVVVKAHKRHSPHSAPDARDTAAATPVEIS